MIRMAADLGNTRLKWGRMVSEVAETGAARAPDMETLPAAPIDDEASWGEIWRASGWETAGAEWRISTVNPDAAERFGRFLADRGGIARWARSARDVAIPNRLDRPEATGADRALAVLAALRRYGRGPGLVISCGTAITVERIDESGVWDGGAIAPGLPALSHALHHLAAQLPRIDRFEPVVPWGRSTVPAMTAGLFWGAVGTVRELIARQSADLSSPWRVWTGGDAERLAPWIDGESAMIAPDLVLRGLLALATELELSA